MRESRWSRTRLLLVDGDDLGELWDALADRELVLAGDVGSFSFERVRALRERVGELLADACVDAGGDPK